MEPIISGATGLFCLLGHPAKHSISPKMHTSAFQMLGLDYVYLAFDVTIEDFPEVVSGLKKMGVKGFNLTMPFKSLVIPYLDEVSEISKLTDSVNTVMLRDGKYVGTTTDGAGYIESLKEKNFSVVSKKITILGAGGAAKSIIAQAAYDKAKEISVFKRKNETFDATVAFAKQVSDTTGCKVSVFDMDDKDAMKKEIASSDLLTNATNVGMEEDTTSLVPKEFLRRDLFVSDIIYHPEMTPLLKDAKSVGAPYLNGKYMLLYQGAKSFELWTGKQMPVDEIKKKLF